VASSFFEGEDDRAATIIPILDAYWRARCPRPRAHLSVSKWSQRNMNTSYALDRDQSTRLDIHVAYGIETRHTCAEERSCFCGIKISRNRGDSFRSDESILCVCRIRSVCVHGCQVLNSHPPSEATLQVTRQRREIIIITSNAYPFHLTVSQLTGSPFRQAEQWPQWPQWPPCQPDPTRSPTFHRLSPGPTAATSPIIS
jgi:hypothetical protein